MVPGMNHSSGGVGASNFGGIGQQIPPLRDAAHDRENDRVAVFRWIAGDGLNNSVEKIIASLKAPAKTPTSSAAGP